MVAVEDQEDIIKENAKDKKRKSSKYCSLMYQGASNVHEDCDSTSGESTTTTTSYTMTMALVMSMRTSYI